MVFPERREGERKKERGGKGGRGRGREGGRDVGRGERVLSLSFKGKVTDPEEEDWTSKLTHEPIVSPLQ